MAYKSELEFIYDRETFPIAAMCKLCGEYMRVKDGPLDAEDAIMWFANQFSNHMQRTHSSEAPSSGV
jgi:hypothetical protein